MKSFLPASFVANHIHERRDPVAGQSMVPGDELAGGVEPGADVMRGDRTEATVANIVLAGPQHLYRFAGLLREQHRVDDKLLVAMAAPAEAAAHQQVVQLHLVAWNAERLGGRLDAVVWLCVPHHISTASPAGETDATALSGSICA